MKKSPASRPAATPPPPVPVLNLPQFSRGWRLLVYPFCVLQPGPAFALGLLYAAQTEPQARRFGRLCLGFSVFGFLIHLATARHFEAMDGGESFLQPFN